MGAEEEEKEKKHALIFTYGTLKKGFSNHGLLQEMMEAGEAKYLGVYRTVEKLPLVCGPYRVPFLLNFPGSGDRVLGELYSISADRALVRMDDLEGTSRGHYERLPVKLVGDEDDDDGEVIRWAEAYYAHRSYAEGMWERNRNKEEGYFSNYTGKQAEGYVYRKDRPQHLSFLDHIRLFLSSSTD
ncbi:putative gamma-glutamylcyclotransferase [Camellia lanceoleosa]|uniref:Gamma-glutamylcyclotransferase n=1 Tax=Camellia lanceoleosa TaxID=1840588 RepID=A0ACC0J2P6_9ERIC|nr:putative gamma-glutamylcyclotransferase [Camellia lanceoleosa]